ncbi:MAG: RDD family protein [Pseudomonadota bacterium]
MHSDALSLHPDPETAPQFYAGVSVKRFFAWIIDAIVVGGLTFIAGLLTLTLAFWFFPLAFVLLGFMYRVWTISTRSATWGMRIMGIELRNRGGLTVTTTEAVVHTLAYSVVLLSGLLHLLTVVLMIATPKGQGLHDFLTGTVMINSPEA